jgi:hypothetical protein
MSDETRGFTMVNEESRPADALPKPDFSGFLISLGTTAYVHLGLIAEPESGERRPASVPLARQTIDMIELLDEKTRGNLTSEEATLLRNLLTDLRMRFVEVARGAGKR